MVPKEPIPEAVVRRLPKYYRYLREAERDGVVRVSSAKMSKDLGLNASQIRRDLNYFGGFGQQGYGYSVSNLKTEIAHILNIDHPYRLVIIGAGNMGHALLNYASFERMGFYIVGLFDNDAKKIDGITVFDIADLEKKISEIGTVEIGIICTPKEFAQETAERLEKIGVAGIWNFSPASISVKDGISVKNVHLTDSLYELCFRMGEQE